MEDIIESRPVKSNRYTMLVDDDTTQTLNELKSRYGLKTRAAVFDLSLTFLNWATSEMERGNRVGRSDVENQFQEVVFLTPKRPQTLSEITK